MGSGEENLIDAAVAGDGIALTELLRRYGPDVRQRLHVSQVWRAALDPADVMQVTYLEAFLRIQQLRARTPQGFLAWLTQLATNNLRDAIKGLERQKRPDPRRRAVSPASDDSYTALLDAVGSPTRTASQIMMRGEAQRLLQAALARLPESYRRVIQLYDLEGQPVGDVATALGRTPGAVYMLRARAHECLRELLGSQSKYFTDSA